MSSLSKESDLYRQLHESPVQRALNIPDLQERVDYVLDTVPHLPLKPDRIIVRPGNPRHFIWPQDGRAVCVRPEPTSAEERTSLIEQEIGIVHILRAVGILAHHPTEVEDSWKTMKRAEKARDTAALQKELQPSDLEEIEYRSTYATYEGKRANIIWFFSAHELVGHHADTFETPGSALFSASELYELREKSGASIDIA
ncbi:MAG: hypothetical protein NUV98_05995 [Candidatus Roizmanbacteria bacterium]|nr:hypothetical protein [Candidatus Roizmanbacteria bacterium]